MTKFDAGKEYQTRDGRRAKVFIRESNGPWPLLGAYEVSPGNWDFARWQVNGRYVDTVAQPTDLMPPEPERRTVWVNIYRDADSGWRNMCSETREDADFRAGSRTDLRTDRIACVPVTFAEGEGLDKRTLAEKIEDDVLAELEAGNNPFDSKPDRAALIADARRAVGPHTVVDLTFPSVQNLSRLVWHLADALEGK